MSDNESIVSGTQQRLNVLVYSGPGSTSESVRHCLYSLRRFLSPNYAVLNVAADVILKEPWSNTCALLVMPGGADLPYCRTLNGEGNRRIRQYVQSGGAYLGFCAGGYYGSSRCEFEVGSSSMEVVGDRELQFYPGVCRGPAFPGFQYNSEEGTRAAELSVEKKAFGNGGALPAIFRTYANGGSVFVDAPKYADRGVEILAHYTEKLNVKSGEGAAAVIYRRVGQGRVVLTGPHPEFAAVNLSKDAKSMKSAVHDALSADDKQRADFLRACLLKLGLHVNQREQALPSLSAIHFSSIERNGVRNVLAELQKEGSITLEDGQEMVKGAVDTFHIQRTSDAWSMSNVSKAITDTVNTVRSAVTGESASSPTTEGARTAQAEKTNEDDSDKIIDYEKIVKKIIAHEDEPPTAQEAPYFNHDAYFAALEAYISSDRRVLYSNVHIGKHLLYGQVVTSTSTLLEKNPNFTNHLPAGTTMTATSQLSGRGRGSNVWISPAGSLMFSFVLRHPLRLQSTAPVVFIQYLAALAVAEGVQTYDADVNRSSATSARAVTSSTPARGYRAMPIKLKWPNDIYALDPAKGANANPADRNNYIKVGGILVNSSYSGGDYNLIVGIGLNTSNSAPTTSLNAVLHALNRRNATNSPKGLGPKPLTAFTLEKLLARILSSFSALYSTFCREGFAGELQELYYRHWLHGEQVVTLEMEGGARARVKGITSDWGLLLAAELVPDGSGGERETGKKWALQTDSNSFDFFKGLLRRKI